MIKKLLKFKYYLAFIIAFVAIVFTVHTASASTSIHIRIVGSQRTIWRGDVTAENCTLKDNANVDHSYAENIAVCALDAASKAGNFTYSIQDSSFGIYLTGIAEDAGASDFSTYWLYDLNGAGAMNGIGTQVVNSGDTLLFHFEPSWTSDNRVINDGITYLRSQQTSEGTLQGFPGIADWAAIAFAVKGIDISTVSNGGSTLKQYMEAHQPTCSSAATDWERSILGIVASGNNPYNFNNLNYVASLKKYYNNNQLGLTSTVNDDWFGVLALIASGVEKTDAVLVDSISYVVTHQNSDGGFGYSSSSGSDASDTSAALAAMAKAKDYGVSNTSLDDAVSKAKTYLLSLQTTNGGFKYDGSTADPDGSSTAWSLIALNATGAKDSTEANNAKKFLMANQEEDGGFHWMAGSGSDTYTTSHAVVGLVGKDWIINTFNAQGASQGAACVDTTPTPTQTPILTPTPTNTPTPTSAPSNNSSTPTPTPVVIYTTPVTNVFNSYLTPTKKPEEKEGDILAKITSVPEVEVLGVKTQNNKIGNWLFLSGFFAGLGASFIFIYLAKLGIIRKLKN